MNGLWLTLGLTHSRPLACQNNPNSFLVDNIGIEIQSISCNKKNRMYIQYFSVCKPNWTLVHFSVSNFMAPYLHHLSGHFLVQFRTNLHSFVAKRCRFNANFSWEAWDKRMTFLWYIIQLCDKLMEGGGGGELYQFGFILKRGKLALKLNEGNLVFL